VEMTKMPPEITISRTPVPSGDHLQVRGQSRRPDVLPGPVPGAGVRGTGMTEDEAMATIVRGFVEPIARELPMEHAIELNRLIELRMEGAVG